jgi:Tfp pilus assembly protein PilF
VQVAALMKTLLGLDLLYADQGRLSEAERALRGREEALEPTHTLTLNSVNKMGMLYTQQGKLGESEQMYERALRGTRTPLATNQLSSTAQHLTF